MENTKEIKLELHMNNNYQLEIAIKEDEHWEWYNKNIKHGSFNEIDVKAYNKTVDVVAKKLRIKFMKKKCEEMLKEAYEKIALQDEKMTIQDEKILKQKLEYESKFEQQILVVEQQKIEYESKFEQQRIEFAKQIADLQKQINNM